MNGEAMTSWRPFPLDALLRAGVSIIALAFIIYRIDFGRLASAFGRLRVEYAPVILILVYGAIVLSVFKWSLLVRARGVKIGVGRLFDFWLIGLFFNNFMPTSIGGDVVQGYEMARRTGRGSDAAATILSDRLIASVALGLTAMVGLLVVPFTPRLVALVAAFAVGTIAVAAVFLHPKLTEKLVERSIGGRLESVGAWGGRTTSAVRELLGDWRLVARTALLAVGFQATLAVINIVIFRALGVSVDLGHALVYVPIISAVTVLPISLSGLGVREAAYVYFFSRVGVDGSSAVAASLIFFVSVAVASLPGAVLFVLARRQSVEVREGTGRARDLQEGCGPMSGAMTGVERLARERAYHHYRDGANCAESVLRALPEALGRSDLEIQPSAAAAWAGGVADGGCLCGALAAAVMVAGVCAGTEHSTRRSRDKAAREMVGRIKKAFDERYGSSCCRTIRRKLSPEAPNSTRYCADITAETAALAASVLARCAGNKIPVAGKDRSGAGS